MDELDDDFGGMSAQVERWLQPCADQPGGENLEYDQAFLDLERAAQGKPETQFAPAEPPNWMEVKAQAEALLDRTRDLRVALPWLRANIALSGVSALEPGLRLLDGWFDSLWDSMHPQNDPDDGDAFARLNVLASLSSNEGLIKDLRQSRLHPDRVVGGVRVRDIEIALDRLPLRDDDAGYTLSQIQGMVSERPPVQQALRQRTASALEHLGALQQRMNERVGIERAVDLQPLREMLAAVASVVSDGESGGEEAQPQDDDAHDDGDADSAPAPRRRGGGVAGIETRADAVKAIQLICAFLDRTEPTNPAQLFLRRAEQLIDKSFLQLVKELAPDAMREVARMVGVDPETMEDE